MLITQFIRDRSDVELERLAREDARWCWWMGHRYGDSYQDESGCLLCNAFDIRHYLAYARANEQHREVERSYMDLADRKGDAETGAMIARLARRELGRRAMAAIGDLNVPAEETTHG